MKCSQIMAFNATEISIRGKQTNKKETLLWKDKKKITPPSEYCFFAEPSKCSVLNEACIQMRRRMLYHHLHKVRFIKWMHKREWSSGSRIGDVPEKPKKYSFTFTGMLPHIEQCTWSYT